MMCEHYKETGMKSNLDKLFKTDESLETKGVWFVIDAENGVEILLKRYGGSNAKSIQAALAKYMKPYAHQIQNGTLDQKKSLEIGVKIFVDSCVIDWKGIEIDGQEVPFTIEAANKLFLSLPELFRTLEKYCSDVENYKEELGNS